MRGRIVVQVVLAVLSAGCGSMSAYDYTSTEGRYRVQFAGKPKVRDDPIPVPGATVIAKVAIHEDWSGTARMVMFIDYPPHLALRGKEDAGLDGACQGMVTQAGLTTLSKTPISINGFPGREVRFESQPGRPGAKLAGRARIYLVGNRLYQVFIAGKTGVVQSDSIESFLNSFALLDQGPGPPGPRVASGPPPSAFPSVGPPAGNVPPGGQRPSNRPRPVPNAPDGPAPAPGRQPRRAGPPVPRGQPDPSPRPNSGQMLAFYNIPDPASAAIEADFPAAGATPAGQAPAATADPSGPAEGPRSDARSSQLAGEAPAPRAEPAASESQPRRNPQPATDPAPLSPREPHAGDATEVPRFLMPSSGGATIVSFDWIDRDDDFVGTDGRLIAPGGGKDEHFRLVIELPPSATVEEVAITGGPVRWTTKPTPHSWPVAVVGNQEIKNRRQSLQVGGFSGRWTFDLYAESDPSIRPGQAFGVEVVVLNRDSRHRVTARCQRK